jgi:hypothetical protein
MKQRNLILTVDFGEAQEWQISATQAQMAAWIEANKNVLPFKNLIIIPTKGETKLWWLEGEIDTDDEDILEKIKDRLEPILHVSLDLKIDREKRFINPNKKRIIKKPETPF